MKGRHNMPDDQKRPINHPINHRSATLSDLLKSSSELAANQENFENTLSPNIELLNARTRNNNSTRDSQYRSKIALILTWAFIIIISIIIIGVPICNIFLDNNAQIDQGRLLESFNSIFGTILGFVLGYYFKERGDGGKQ